MTLKQGLSTALLLLGCSLSTYSAAQESSPNRSQGIGPRITGIDIQNRPQVPASILRLYNIYGRRQDEPRTKNSGDSNQQSDTVTSNADVNQQNAETEQPNNGQQSPSTPQYPQDTPYNQPPHLNPGAQQFLNGGPDQISGQFPQVTGQFPNGFNFGVQPGNFNFQHGPPPAYNYNTNTKESNSEAVNNQNGYQQNFPPINFRTNVQVSKQYDGSQNVNPAPAQDGRQYFGSYAGVNANAYGSPPPGQQIQGYGQFNGFPFNNPNLGANFQQQFATPPNFGNTSTEIATPNNNQNPIVGFYGGAPNIGGYSFNPQSFQAQQQQQGVSGPSGIFGPRFGQYSNGVSQFSGLGDGIGSGLGGGIRPDQIGNNFARFAYNPAAFQSGSLSPQSLFGRNFGSQQGGSLSSEQQ